MAVYSRHFPVSDPQQAGGPGMLDTQASREAPRVAMSEVAAGAFFLAFSTLLVVMLTLLIQVSPAPRGPLP